MTRYGTSTDAIEPSSVRASSRSRPDRGSRRSTCSMTTIPTTVASGEKHSTRSPSTPDDGATASAARSASSCSTSATTATATSAGQCRASSRPVSASTRRPARSTVSRVPGVGLWVVAVGAVTRAGVPARPGTSAPAGRASPWPRRRRAREDRLMTRHAIVVGAGIAGLTSAVSLARTGWDVTVLERAAEAGEVGAGFAMSRNAVAAFRGLGFDDDDVAALGYATRAGGPRALHGRPILALPDTAEMRASVALVGVHRRRLHAALRRRAADLGVEVVTGTPVEALDPGDPEGRPAVVAGREADLVVGADGMRSAVRSVLFPAVRPVHSGYASWRAVVPGAYGDVALRQYWGPHAEFGVLRVAADETYWYGYVAMPERTRLRDELAAARARFDGWAEPVRDVLAATPPDVVLRHDVHHLPRGVPRYASGRVVLAGDAAHGTLPTMGQGA